MFVQGATFTRKTWVPQPEALSDEYQIDGLVLAGSSANSVGRTEFVKRGLRRAGKRWVRKHDLPGNEKGDHRPRDLPRQFGKADPTSAGRVSEARSRPTPGRHSFQRGAGPDPCGRGENDHAAAGRDSYIAVIGGIGHISNVHRRRSPTPYGSSTGNRCPAGATTPEAGEGGFQSDVVGPHLRFAPYMENDIAAI